MNCSWWSRWWCFVFGKRSWRSRWWSPSVLCFVFGKRSWRWSTVLMISKCGHILWSPDYCSWCFWWLQSVDILMGCYSPDDGPLILVFPMMSCGLQIIVPDASGDSKVWTLPDTAQVEVYGWILCIIFLKNFLHFLLFDAEFDSKFLPSDRDSWSLFIVDRSQLRFC